jgi:hypothetical protein
MATRTFRGDVQAVAQVSSITISGVWGTADTATVTINTKSVTVTIGTATATTDVAAAVAAAFNGDALIGDETRNTTGSLITEMAGITALAASSSVTFTADTAGEPHTITVSESTASTGVMGSVTVTTANAGPNNLEADNVTGGSLAAAGNELSFENNTIAVSYGLDQSAAGTWDSLLIPASNTGKIGLPKGNGSGTSFYHEYRDRALNIRATTVMIGEGDGAGSARIILDLGAVASTVNVYKTATSDDKGRHALRLIGTSLTALNVSGGTVDAAVEDGAVATITTLRASGSSKVRTSEGAAVTTIVGSGSAALDIDSSGTITTISLYGQQSTILRTSQTVTTLNLFGGTLDKRGTGTITTLNTYTGSTLTTDNSSDAFTITNSNLYGGSIIDNGAKITWTNASSVPNGIENLTLQFGKGISFRVS